MKVITLLPYRHLEFRIRVIAMVYLTIFMTTRSLTIAASPEDAIGFQNFAVDPMSGITYRRTPSTSFSVFDTFRRNALDNPATLEDSIGTPSNPLGQTGVAILDYDNEGLLDALVANA